MVSQGAVGGGSGRGRAPPWEEKGAAAPFTRSVSETREREERERKKEGWINEG
jgi:hypothetical protein